MYKSTLNVKSDFTNAYEIAKTMWLHILFVQNGPWIYLEALDRAQNQVPSFRHALHRLR